MSVTERPLPTWVILSTDGASNGNSGIAAVGRGLGDIDGNGLEALRRTWTLHFQS